jgi:hypothetical protein
MGHNCQTYIEVVTAEYSKLFTKLSMSEQTRINQEKRKIENYWRTHFTKRLIDSKLAALE